MVGRDRLMDVYEYAISFPFGRISAADTAIMMPRGPRRGQWPALAAPTTELTAGLKPLPPWINFCL